MPIFKNRHIFETFEVFIKYFDVIQYGEYRSILAKSYSAHLRPISTTLPKTLQGCSSALFLK